MKSIHLRKKYYLKLNNSIAKMAITVLIGARQIGKSSILNSLQVKGKRVYLDGQLEETNQLFQKQIAIIDYLKLKLDNDINGLLIIDEFQMIKNISSTLKVLVDNYPNLKVLCSGSSSIDIIQKVEESLAGRIRMIDAYSLSYSESILFKYNQKLLDEYNKYTINTPNAVISKDIKSMLNQHLTFGGMPRTWLEKSPSEKIRILTDIYNTYLLRDVKSFVKNEDSIGFNKLIRLLALQIGNLVNVNELSRNTGLTYKKCEDYIYLLEQMYIIKLIEPYASNKRKVIKKMKKVYFLDLGIRNIIIQNFNPPELRVDNGALFENFVLLELLKNKASYTKIYFYRTRDGAEVDFILNDMLSLTTVEVKYKTLSKPMYLKAFSNFNLDENVKSAYVINKNYANLDNHQKYITPALIEKIFVPEFK